MTDPAQLIIPASLDGVRIDRAVATLTGMSRTEIAALLAAGAVSADGAAVTTASRKVRAGSVLSLPAPVEIAESGVEPDPSVEVNAVYEDRDIVVVDKAPGVVVHPGAGRMLGTLVAGLLARYPDMAVLAASGVCDPLRPGIVHRLDKGTSGLMVVARTAPAFGTLTAKIAAREVHRAYRALVWGTLADDAGVVDAPVGRSRRDRTLMAVAHDGKPAITRYTVEARYAAPVEATLLSCELESGRTHQIRVHLSALGHPVVGDARYGGGITAKRDPGGAVPLRRPFLHACRLSFAHPVTDKELSFESGLPPDLAALTALTPTALTPTA